MVGRAIAPEVNFLAPPRAHVGGYQPSLDELEVGDAAVFVGLNFVLGVCSRSTHGFLGVRERAERETHLLRRGASFVFYALMDAVVGRCFPVIDAMEGELETLEGPNLRTRRRTP